MSPANHQGIGDCIRGLFATLDYAKPRGIRVSVDMSGHRLEPFLEYRTPQDVRDRALKARGSAVVLFFGNKGTIPHALQKVRARTVLIRTNLYPGRLPSEEDRAFVRGLLRVRPEWRVSPPAAVYGLIHARTGDNVSVRGQSLQSLPGYVARMIEKTLERRTPFPWFFMADSRDIYSMVRSRFPDLAAVGHDADPRFSAAPGHVGLSTSAGQIATTVRDMQLICGAKEIVTGTCYPWTSGFVLCLATAFGVKVSSYQPGHPLDRSLIGSAICI